MTALDVLRLAGWGLHCVQGPLFLHPLTPPCTGQAGEPCLTYPQPYLKEPSVTRLTHLWPVRSPHARLQSRQGAAEARPAGGPLGDPVGLSRPSRTPPRLPAPGTGPLGHSGRLWPPGIAWLQPRQLTEGLALVEYVGDPTLFPGLGGGETGCPPP